MTGLLSRSESTQERKIRMGAKLLNRKKHLERTGPESKGGAGKASRALCDRLNKISRTVSLGVQAFGLC